jgi:hypothetical protein
MKKFAFHTALLVGTALFTTPACASVYSDDLGRCLVSKTSDQDKTQLVQWVFAAMSSSPAVQKLTVVTPTQRDGYDRLTGKLVERLLEIDCRKETVDAIKYDGPHSLEAAFGLLGQVAFKSLAADPAVNQSLGNFTKYVDETNLKALFREAGLTPPPAGAAPAK